MGRVKEKGMIVSGFAKSFRHPQTTQQEPIDFVVTWVDGNDPAWQEERARTLGLERLDSNGNGVCRYRDWSSFLYWFRAVEQFAPWVRYVHLVTWGHVPKWLNTQCPKLKIVNHRDFIPEEYLPTYNCQPIELNIFRIPGLSEHFVYFNDDILLARPVKPEDFFVGGLPVHTGIARPWINRDNELPYHLFFNTYGVANRENDIRSCIQTHPEKWFSYVYGREIRHNIAAWKSYGLPGMLFTHMGVPYRRSAMERVWKKYERYMEESCSYKLRHVSQITHQIFSIEDILRGEFEPGADDWGVCVNIEDGQTIRDVYMRKAYKMICLSDRDNMTQQEIDTTEENLTRILGEWFPHRSCFERG